MLEGATCPHKPTVLCGWGHVQVLGEFGRIDTHAHSHLAEYFVVTAVSTCLHAINPHNAEGATHIVD